MRVCSTCFLPAWPHIFCLGAPVARCRRCSLRCALSLSGPFFVCDCDHSVDVAPMLQLLPWSSPLIPTWPINDVRGAAWGKCRVAGGGRVVEVCEKEDLQA